MINLTSKNFEEEVLKSEKPVLVDFWATWCGPCQMIVPIVEEIAKENEDKLKVGKVNVDEATDLAVKFDVASIPTLILFRNGNIVGTIVGYREKEELEKFINLQKGINLS